MSGETYVFMSAPAAVEGDRRRKYREQAERDELGAPSNMMFDPRVNRGVTCVKPDNVARVNALKEAQAIEPKRHRTSKATLIRQGKIRATPPSVAQLHEKIVVAKERVEVPLHLYLLEQGTPVGTCHEEAQTDAFLAEPPTPDYIPEKRGVDVETQVENEALFNFDRDVATILAVVISKTMEQSLLEVRQEEELRWMSSEKSRLEDKETARKREAEQLELQERSRLLAKAEIIAKEHARAEQEKQLQEKLDANVFSRRFLQGLQESCFEDLTRLRVFYDPVEKESESFIPWLKDQVMHNLSGSEGKFGGLEEKRNWVDSLLQNALNTIQREAHQAYTTRLEQRQLDERQRAEREQAARDALFRNRKLKLKIRAQFLEARGAFLPSISTQASATIGATVEKILLWMEENVSEVLAANQLVFTLKDEPIDHSRFLWELGEDLSGLSLSMQREDTEDPDPDQDDAQDE